MPLSNDRLVSPADMAHIFLELFGSSSHFRARILRSARKIQRQLIAYPSDKYLSTNPDVPGPALPPVNSLYPKWLMRYDRSASETVQQVWFIIF